MPYLKNICILLVVVHMICSCDKFLEEPLYGLRQEEELANSEETLEALVEGMFGSMKEIDYYNSIIHEFLAWHSGILMRRRGGHQEIAEMKLDPSFAWIESMYEHIYHPISKANIILEITDTSSSLANAKNARGLAYFVRAYNYFNLVRLFGPTPLVLKSINIYEEANKPRPGTVDSVYKQIESDLLNAAQLIDIMPENQRRPKRMAAYALLSKIYLTWAGYGHITDKSKYWQLAKDYAQLVIDSEGMEEGYNLFPDYSLLFDLENENNEESIFELNFSKQIFTDHFVPVNSGWSSFGMGGRGRIKVSREWIDTVTVTHQGMDNRVQTNIVYSYDNVNIEERGPDAYYTYPIDPDDVPQGSRYESLPGIQKYKDPEADDDASRNNFYLLRYAEILLIYAEADNELNGPTQKAIDYVNKLLERSRNSTGVASTIPVDIQLTDFNSVPGKTPQKAFFDRIMVERLAELVGEGHEWFDTRRRGTSYLKSVFENHNKRLVKAEEEGIFNERLDFYFPVDDEAVLKNMLAPIPQREIDVNVMISLEDQNPGYK